MSDPPAAHRPPQTTDPSTRARHYAIGGVMVTARGTDGYQTVWSYQRLSATCAEHEHPRNGST
jgi:hypothetical protein